MEGLTEGRIVHFVTEWGEHRPAIVVKVWRDLQGSPPGYSNLQVFSDGSNDGDWGRPNVVWETAVSFSEEPKPHTWHWIKRA